MVPFDPASLAGIRTRFVRDRVAETRFAARASLGTLIFWETLAAGGGPHQWTSAIVWGQFRSAHPVECLCILEELQSGVYTDTTTYRRLLAEHRAAGRQEREERAAAARAGEAREREAWLRRGGRP